MELFSNSVMHRKHLLLVYLLQISLCSVKTIICLQVIAQDPIKMTSHAGFIIT